MATLELTLDSVDPSFSRRFTLDDLVFELDFDWSEVAQAWFLSILDAEENRLLSGYKIVVDSVPNLQFLGNAAFPAGILIFVDSSDGSDPLRYDLGERVKLIYVEREDFDTLQT